ncbi:MAG TPA: lipopolysaccharide biosynthesis protein [Pyrinomonadaceae bacterium]|nr:lipopolysaccharide biosynthesis protein [Pyrinomonadaceae bacterium]
MLFSSISLADLDVQEVGMITNNSSSVAQGDAILVDVAPREIGEQGGASKGVDPNEKHLNTDHLLGDLKGRTIFGTFVTIAAQAVKFLLNLAFIMALARLLSPKDFGLYAMVTTIMGFLWIFQDIGLSTATVQRQKISHTQVSNLFWVNVGVGSLVTLVVAASAPVIAWFYREPRLVGITLVLSVTFLLTTSAVQHIALLNRQMRFGAIAIIEIASVLGSYLTGVGMALSGYGYWALVGANVMQVVVRLVLSWSISRWLPRLPSRNAQTRHLLSFGANITIGNLINTLARGLDNVLIGRFFGPVPVGLYSRASILLMRPLEQFTLPINAVLIPTLSRVQTEPERYRRTFLRVYEAMALVSFLCTGFLLALARPLTLFVLGPKWEQAVPIFAGFTIAALWVPLTGASTWLFQTQGRGKDWLFASMLCSCITIAAFIVGLPFGPVGLATAYSTAGLLFGTPAVFYFAGRRGPVTTADLWSAIFRYLPLWIVVCSVTWLVRLPLVNSRPLVQLVVCAPVGLFAGAILICLVPHMRRVAFSLVDILLELKPRISFFNAK